LTESDRLGKFAPKNVTEIDRLKKIYSVSTHHSFA